MRFDEPESASRRGSSRAERRNQSADRTEARSSRRSSRQTAESREASINSMNSRTRRASRVADRAAVERQTNARSRNRGNVVAPQEAEREGARISRAAQDQKKSKREERRRERSKTRAERLFAKQYESGQGRQAAADGDADAPRAALYEGKMGASHRKSTRMQRASSAAPQSAKLNPAGWLSGLQVKPRTLKAFTAVLCVVLVAVFLYVPAQQYYQAQREHDRLAAEYAVLEQRNTALDSQNDSLSSNAGMEDAVRQKYGYVVEGDQAGYVVGLSDNATDTSRDSENIEANVLSSAVKAPEEWYTPYLDAFFGVY